MNFKCDVYELRCLARERSLTNIYVEDAYHIADSLIFYSTGHTTGSPRRLDPSNIRLIQLPYRILRMTEDPEVIPTHITQLSQVRLVDPRDM